jgi:hypothetical protein
VSAIDCRIDFAEFPDKIADREQGEFAHLRAPWASRENLRPSKSLRKPAFIFRPSTFSNVLHPMLPTNQHLFHIGVSASSSSMSMKAGGAALRSFTCA